MVSIIKPLHSDWFISNVINDNIYSTSASTYPQGYLYTCGNPIFITRKLTHTNVKHSVAVIPRLNTTHYVLSCKTLLSHPSVFNYPMDLSALCTVNYSLADSVPSDCLDNVCQLAQHNLHWRRYRKFIRLWGELFQSYSYATPGQNLNLNPTPNELAVWFNGEHTGEKRILENCDWNFGRA